MVAKTVDVMDLCGIFKPKLRGVTLESMNEAIREHASQKFVDGLKLVRAPRSNRRS